MGWWRRLVNWWCGRDSAAGPRTTAGAWQDANEYVDDTFTGWLCWCGHWEESDLHCSNCGNEPPWGCACGACEEPEHDDGRYYDEDYDEYWDEDCFP